MLSLISQKLFSIKLKVFLLLSLNQIPLRNCRNQISPVRNWDKQRVIEAYLFFTSLFLQPQFWEELEHLFRSVCGRRGLGLVQVQLEDSSSDPLQLLNCWSTGLVSLYLHCEMVQMGSESVWLWSSCCLPPTYMPCKKTFTHKAIYSNKETEIHF